MTGVWISELSLSGFGLYSESVTFSFSDGLNTVIGGNETGKSTMAAGVCAVLFGIPTNVDPTAYGSSRFRSWHKPEPFKGRLRLVDGDLNYEIHRDFVSHRVTVREITGGAAREIIRGLHNPRAARPNPAYLAFLRMVTGVETAELFRQIYFVEQPLPGQNSLSKDLQQLLSGGGHYENVRDLLRSRLKNLTRNPDHYDVLMNPGRKDQQLEERQAELADLTRSVERSRESLSELMSLAADLESRRITLSQGQSQLGFLRSRREALMGLTKLQKQVGKAAEQRRQLARARQQIAGLLSILHDVQVQLGADSDLSCELARLNALAQTLTDVIPAVPGDETVTIAMERELTGLRGRREQVKLTEARIDTLRSRLEAHLGPRSLQPEHSDILLGQLSEIRSSSYYQRPDLRPLFAGVALAALLYLPGVPRLPVSPYLLPLFSVGVGAAASVLLFAWSRRCFRQQERRIIAQFERQPSLGPSLLKELAEAASECNSLEADCSKSSSAEISHDIKEVEARLGRWMALSESYRTVKDRERRLKSQVEAHRFALAEVTRAHGLTDVAELDARLQLADDDYYYARRTVEQYVRDRSELPPGEVIDEGDADELIAAIERAEHELAAETSALDGQIRDLLYRQSKLEGTHPPNIAQAEERLEELAAICRSMQFEAQACGVALRELDAAVREFQGEYRLQISELIAAHYRTMTGIRRSVFFDDEFNLKLREPDGIEVDPCQLSQGARDQLYIALRLALTEFMSPRSRFPLVFDDPFLTSDDERLGNIRSSLALADRQIILLSHNPIFSSWGSAAVRTQ